MEFVRGLHNLSPRHRGCALTVGNYDGVHLGHQAMIRVVRERAAMLKVPSAVLAFEPSSKEFLDPNNAPPRLTRWREKFLHLADSGVDRFISLRFDDQMRDMKHEEFVQRVMVNGLGVRHMVVGPDFRYGSAAAGSVNSLRDVGEVHGFQVEQMSPVMMDGTRISSTRIRESLAQGRFDGASSMLGRNYRMMGRVTHGQKLGRTLGFPTANLPLKRKKSPVWGVLAVRVFGISAEGMPAVASLGTRPTVDGVEPLLEVHLFDFTGDLYGRPLEVEFVQKLRDEEKFASLEAMVEQMNEDAKRARTVLS